jgi:pyruvate kinase
MLKKTKIVCTIGPVTESEEKLAELLNAGMNVMRLNFSHGDFAEHQKKADNLAKAIKKTGIPCAVMQDLGGPKIRIGDFEKGVITLKEGQKFTLTTDKVMGNEERVSVNYAPLPKEVKKGGTIMLHDGKKKLEILDIKGNDVICKVLVGGEIKNRRGINLPGAYLSISSLTEKDKADIEFGIKNDVDFVAFSFVRRAEDALELRAILDKRKSKAKIVAKIEDVEGLENFDKLLEVVDGVMVARGDLAIEIGAENVPLVQKEMIEKCNAVGKFVITATHMLESMIKNPVPTRAEVSDIANAILDGTDAIMLSEETTLGDYPVHAVKLMTTVAQKIEGSPRHQALTDWVSSFMERKSHNDEVTLSAVNTAREVSAKVVVAFSLTGESVRKLARLKPDQEIIVFTPDKKTFNQVLFSYGASPVLCPKFKDVEEALKFARTHLVKEKIAAKGDTFVATVGLPISKAEEANTLFVQTV